MPESTASSTRYCTTGLSTMGISSLGRFLVAGRKRVPKPATAITAFLIFKVVPSQVSFSNAVCPGATASHFGKDSTRTARPSRRGSRVDPRGAGRYLPEGLQARRGRGPTSILHGRAHVVNLPRLLFRLLLGRRLPATRGTRTLVGLNARVEVRRDRWGIPYIEADNDHDAWFALGFCHGQDRAFQLELLLRVVRGTLAELVGGDVLPVDRLSRRIG